MSDEKTTLLNAVEVLVRFARNTHLRRAMAAVDDKPHLSFWRLLYGDLTDLSALDWCKLFGSDDTQRQSIHWKNVVANPDEFRAALLQHLKISREEWDAYWDKLKKYRDREVAHLDPRRVEIETYPDFDLALEAAYFYYDHLNTRLKALGDWRFSDDIRAYSRSFSEQSNRVATVAMGATKTLFESAN